MLLEAKFDGVFKLKSVHDVVWSTCLLAQILGSGSALFRHPSFMSDHRFDCVVLPASQMKKGHVHTWAVTRQRDQRSMRVMSQDVD
jgi:hypothetical protein